MYSVPHLFMLCRLLYATTSVSDLTWENPACHFFSQTLRSRYILTVLLYRTNLDPNLREIARYFSEIQCLLCVCTQIIELEKVRSKDVAHMSRLSVYYAYIIESVDSISRDDSDIT